MSSMALVHSRISKLFYAYSNPKNGGISSFFKIFALENNHTFRAFQYTSEHLQEKENEQDMGDIEEEKKMKLRNSTLFQIL